jgi:hypothetical protein
MAMTFAVVRITENRERVVGTIWADGESEAQQMATSVLESAPETQPERWTVRRSEGREIPLRMTD